ncbi:DNA alkylation repair protein [Candidatus Woesearchaeota archaeon]|nr:DNA alkylation repair protein [Candidatus Woesearchaeota archaeon]
MLPNLKKDLLRLKNKEKAKILSRFFKTGPGGYGEGDIFLGITVPDQRKIAIKYKDIALDDAGRLMLDKIHEFRLTAILTLVQKFQNGNEAIKKEIVNFYLKNTNKINNWDLVDLSADKILGAYLIDKDKSILYKLANSENIWKKRIAIISTFYFIKNNKFEDVLKISEILLKDKHDLIQKAVGWMLREIGKRNQEIEEDFLKKYYKEMPRTMLRYAIEIFDEKKKKQYMK